MSRSYIHILNLSVRQKSRQGIDLQLVAHQGSECTFALLLINDDKDKLCRELYTTYLVYST